MPGTSKNYSPPRIPCFFSLPLPLFLRLFLCHFYFNFSPPFSSLFLPSTPISSGTGSPSIPHTHHKRDYFAQSHQGAPRTHLWFEKFSNQPLWLLAIFRSSSILQEISLSYPFSHPLPLSLSRSLSTPVTACHLNGKCNRKASVVTFTNAAASNHRSFLPPHPPFPSPRATLRENAASSSSLSLSLALSFSFYVCDQPLHFPPLYYSLRTRIYWMDMFAKIHLPILDQRQINKSIPAPPRLPRPANLNPMTNCTSSLSFPILLSTKNICPTKNFWTQCSLELK